MNIILLIVFIISIAYLLIISIFSIGWFCLGYYFRSDKVPSTKVSLIIPARNEEKNILNCLNDIIRQEYPKELFEIIVVDDFSEDKTLEVIENFINANNIQNNNIRVICLNSCNSYSGKKAALNRAINEAVGELIITTDADCRMGNNWLATIADYYETKNPKMLIGPVRFSNTPLSPLKRGIGGVFKKLQSLEFLSLIGITAGSAAINKPIMCNGANLAFEKKVFIEIGGYNENSTYAGGDDMFTMESIHRRYKRGVHFLKNKDAIVYTEPKNNIRDFLNQRKRWVSKTKGYKSLRIIVVAFIVYLFNFSLLVLFVSSLFIYKLFFIFICLFIAKSLVDFPVLSGITGFMNTPLSPLERGTRGVLKLLIPLEFINVIYVSAIGFIGNFLKYKWKNRIINK